MKRQHISITDEELLEQVKGGDKDAFKTLYSRYASPVMAYCLKAMPSREAAEDVFQTVMTNVFAKKHQFSQGVFAAWLFTIARNQCLKEHKRRRSNADLDAVAEVVDEFDTTGHDFLMQQELHRAIELLPEDFREPLRLRFFFECSYREISQELDISESLAKVRVFRAKNMLKKRLEKHVVGISS